MHSNSRNTINSTEKREKMSVKIKNILKINVEGLSEIIVNNLRAVRGKRTLYYSHELWKSPF